MHGVWMKHEAGDVHIYFDDKFVIGHNKNHTTMKFTPLALCLTKDNKFHLQLDIDGEPKQFEIPEEAVKTELLRLLSNLKATVC